MWKIDAGESGSRGSLHRLMDDWFLRCRRERASNEWNEIVSASGKSNYLP